ncbi:alpha/beta fold hydrolase [Saccharopolyspora cebuensis]|uniref:Alpha/beta fold hydrolase n=1 Tax=Saccharopolyspora cebuensis TaxID=418759 RepID=A0ABV4CF14_9PSEU
MIAERTTTTSSGVVLWSQSWGRPGDPVVLLVMGANANALGWPDEFVEALVARGLRVIRYDHRDTGRSTHFDITAYGVADLAADAVAVLDGHGVEAAHVVGLSMGGTLGQVLALDHPGRVRSLVLMLTAALDVDFGAALSGARDGEPGGLPVPSSEVVAVLAHRADPVSDVEAALDRRVAEWRVLAGGELPFDAARFRAWERAAIEHAGTARQPSAHGRAVPVPVERGAELARVAVPALVVQGAVDPVNPVPHGAHLAGLIPGARCVTVPGLGHALPAALHPLLVDLVAGHVSAAG